MSFSASTCETAEVSSGGTVETLERPRRTRRTRRRDRQLIDGSPSSRRVEPFEREPDRVHQRAHDAQLGFRPVHGETIAQRSIVPPS
jgi:hypothetical protein